MQTTRGVILARGLGTRMAQPDPEAVLDAEQQRAANAGLKAMLPVHGRPFLDYVLSAAADAGLDDIALVVAPDHASLRDYYEGPGRPRRVRLSYVVQQEALGTANAVLAAESWTAGTPFLCFNADNLYPVTALRKLAALAEPGLAVFDRDALIGSGEIPPDRIGAFALVELDARGCLAGIVEKPSEAAIAAWRGPVLVSMNCWRFDARIFAACRAVPRSPRGEYELPQAVMMAVESGVPFRGVSILESVLDLSRRADAAVVGRRLAHVVPNP